MWKYLVQMRLSVLDLLEYRFDFLMHICKYAAMVILMSMVWIAVGRENPESNLDPTTTAQYFAWGAILYSLSNFHTYYIEDDIKMGQLSRLLLRPMSAFGFYFSHQLGSAIIETLIKISVLVPFLMWFGWQAPTLPSLLLTLTFLPLIFWTAFNILALISTATFWLTEAWALRWSLTITLRFLSGILVPIALFPEMVQRTLWYTPLPHLASTPILLLQKQLSFNAASQGLLILFSWSIVLYVVREWIWRQGLRQYENVGV